LNYRKIKHFKEIFVDIDYKKISFEQQKIAVFYINFQKTQSRKLTCVMLEEKADNFPTHEI